MQIEILGADSIGVRSLATFVRTETGGILIDPGVSVAPRRDGLPPHPVELEALRRVRDEIQTRAAQAAAIVITHFHHDHYSSFEDRPLDLTSPATARAVYRDLPVYVKDWRRNLNRAQKARAVQFLRNLGRRVVPADGRSLGQIAFSPAVKHGEAGSKQGWVVMASVAGARERLVFGSDIQLIERESVDWILDQNPTIVITSGPPIYLSAVSEGTGEKARANLLRLVEAVPTTVVDHHLLRTEGYLEFLRDAVDLAGGRGHRLLTAAEFMGRPNALLEANRKRLWNQRSGESNAEDGNRKSGKT